MAKKPLDEDPDFEEGEHEEDIYDEEGREELEESDEITELEEGFVEGFEEGEHQAKCVECGKILIEGNFVEEELEGHHYRFCSEECASAFETGKKVKGKKK